MPVRTVAVRWVGRARRRCRPPGCGIRSCGNRGDGDRSRSTRSAGAVIRRPDERIERPLRAEPGNGVHRGHLLWRRAVATGLGDERPAVMVRLPGVDPHVGSRTPGIGNRRSGCGMGHRLRRFGPTGSARPARLARTPSSKSLRRTMIAVGHGRRRVRRDRPSAHRQAGEGSGPPPSRSSLRRSGVPRRFGGAGGCAGTSGVVRPAQSGGRVSSDQGDPVCGPTRSGECTGSGPAHRQ